MSQHEWKKDLMMIFLVSLIETSSYGFRIMRRISFMHVGFQHAFDPFLLPLNSQQNCNHWTTAFFGSSHHILPAICEITDPVCTIGRHKKTARLLRCPLDCPRTSLNLFATKFDQVLNILAKRQEDLDYILIDSCYLLLILFGWLMFLLVGAGGR